MTKFERLYMNNIPNQFIIYPKYDKYTNAKYIDVSEHTKNYLSNYKMQMEYRELDKLSMELEKEIKAIKAIRLELERYKANLNLSIEDEATKKIQELLDKMLS